MTAEEAPSEPVRKSVRVDRSTEEAFRLFTEHIHRWWPVEVHSRAAREGYGAGVKVERVVFEPRAGGRLYEVTSEGVEGVWGEVVAFEPPARIVLAWKPTTGQSLRPRSRSASYRTETGRSCRSSIGAGRSSEHERRRPARVTTADGSCRWSASSLPQPLSRLASWRPSGCEHR